MPTVRRTYRMQRNVWFRVEPEVPGFPVPHYLGHGVVFSPEYHSLTNFQTPMPNHGVIKICLTRGGIFGSEQHGERKLEPGQCLLRIFGERDVWDRYDPQHDGDWEFLGLIFRGEGAMAQYHGLIERFGRVLRFPIDGPLMQRLNTVVAEPSESVELSAADGARLVFDVLLAVAEQTQTEHDAKLEPGDRLARRVLHTIRQRLHESLDVQDLADAHDVSREHLTRVVSHSLGQSPAKLITRAKIDEAKQLLRHTRLPVKTIMHRVGYTSTTTFFRAFRRAVGQSPAQYRQTGQNAAQTHFAEQLADADSPFSK